jgi:SAM-dependent methyltransferase
MKVSISPGLQKTNDATFDRFFNFVQRHRLHSSKTNLRFYLNHLFKGVSFKGKSMLDIGAGSGLYSLYAAFRGARPVICLEPEVEGSSQGISHVLNEICSHFPEGTMIPLHDTFQDFDSGGRRFDIVLLNYSINHLDEQACINLRRSREAYDKYREIFTKLSKITNPGGKLIAADCSRYNFFSLLGLRNPMWPDIDWYKHQTPWYWARMLSNFGFINRKITWVPSKHFGTIGSLATRNPFASFFLKSLFILTMDREKDSLE